MMSGYFLGDEDEVFFDCLEESLLEGSCNVSDVLEKGPSLDKSSEGLGGMAEVPMKKLWVATKSTAHLKPSLGKPWKFRRVIGFGCDVTYRKNASTPYFVGMFASSRQRGIIVQRHKSCGCFW
jgi:hypothetical protein